jgi:transcriptional regulator with XRE-family HTH domain
MARSHHRHAFAVEFGRRMRARRAEMGWSQERLADVVGLHWTYVGPVERGERNISLLNILRIADALEIDAGRLVTGIPPPTAGDIEAQVEG